MNDDEYLIELVYSNHEPKLLQRLASVYKNKFRNNLEMRNTVVQYAVSSYLEPDCFPSKSPVEEIPDLILSDSLFIHAWLNKLSETDSLGVIVPDLITLILNNIHVIPDDSLEIHYYQLQNLFTNKNVLLYYVQHKFEYFELLFNPRLCPDMYTILILPKEKTTILKLSNQFEILYTKISEVLLLFLGYKETRSQTIEYLYSFVEKNKGRKKTVRDSECHFDGVVLNFLGTMLVLCEPFLAIHSNKATKINTQEPDSNFISQCFQITSKMVDYGFLTTLQSLRVSQMRFDQPENEYLSLNIQAQLFNKSLLTKLKKFVFLQLHIINKHQLKDDDLVESIWKTVDCLTHLKMVDYELINYVLQYYCQSGGDSTNYHLRCELGRTTASTLTLGIVSPTKNVMEKLLSLYGNLPNVDTLEQFRCRQEISKCIELYDITNIDKVILSDFGYALLSEVDTLSSKALDDLIKIKINIDNQEDIEEEQLDELKMSFDYANEIMRLLKKMTQLIPASFKSECALQKTASAWSFLIYRLVGPQSLKLKIANPGSYHFYPKEMLSQSVIIFENLKSEKLLDHIGQVGLLDTATFNKLIWILKREKLFSETVIEDFKQTLTRINIQIEQEDAPEEFYDSIMGSIMKDPVRLPSGNVVDKMTILQHLKNDTSDPFTRQEMTEEDLVYDEDLKVRIQSYLQNKN